MQKLLLAILIALLLPISARSAPNAGMGGGGGGGSVTPSTTDTFSNKTILGGENLAVSVPSTNTVRTRSHATDCKLLNASAAMAKGDECYDSDNMLGWICANPSAGGNPSYCDVSTEWSTRGGSTTVSIDNSGISLGTNNYVTFKEEASGAGITRLVMGGSGGGSLYLTVPGSAGVGPEYATLATLLGSPPINQCVKFGATGLLEGSGIDCGTMTCHDNQTAAQVVYTPGAGGIIGSTVQAFTDNLATAVVMKTSVGKYLTDAGEPGILACTNDGDFYRQTNTVPDTLWVCQAHGATGVWAALNRTELGSWFVDQGGDSGLCLRTMAAAASRPGIADLLTCLDAGQPTVNAMVTLPITVDHVVIHNRLALSGHDGCKFTVQKVTIDGTVTTITTIDNPPTGSPVAAQQLLNAPSFTPVPLVAGDFVRVKVEDSPATCQSPSCLCDEGDAFLVVVSGAR